MKKSTRRMITTLSLAMLLLASSLSVSAFGEAKFWSHHLPERREGKHVAHALCKETGGSTVSLYSIDSASQRVWVLLRVYDYGRWIDVSENDTYVAVGGRITVPITCELNPGKDVALMVGNHDWLLYEAYATGIVRFP